MLEEQVFKRPSENVSVLIGQPHELIEQRNQYKFRAYESDLALQARMNQAMQNEVAMAKLVEGQVILNQDQEAFERDKQMQKAKKAKI